MVQNFHDLVSRETASWDPHAPLDEDWKLVKELLTEAAGEVFGHQKAKNQDWFSTNLEQLQPLLD